MKTKSQLIIEAYANANDYKIYGCFADSEFFKGYPYCGSMGFADDTGFTKLDPVVVNVAAFGETAAQVWDTMLDQLTRTIGRSVDELAVELDINYAGE